MAGAHDASLLDLYQIASVLLIRFGAAWYGEVPRDGVTTAAYGPSDDSLSVAQGLRVYAPWGGCSLCGWFVVCSLAAVGGQT